MRRINLLFLTLLVSGTMSGAAFNATAIWRLSTVNGNDSYGGAFDPNVGSPGTDESLSAGTSATFTLAGTGTTATSSPAFTSTAHGPGNFIQITGQTSGTCTNGTYEELSQTAGVGTFNVAMGTAASVCTGYIGGPALTLAHVTALVVAGNNVCIKADGTYSVAANTTMVSSTSGVNLLTNYQGYTSTCGVGGVASDGGQATIQASAAMTGMLTIGSNNIGLVLSNLVLDCNSEAGTVRGINATAQTQLTVFNVLIKNCATTGITNSNSGSIITFQNSRVTGSLSGCTAGIQNNTSAGGLFVVEDSVSDTNLCHGVVSSTAGAGFVCIRSVSANNTGTSDGFRVAGQDNGAIQFTNCAAYDNGEYGLDITGGSGQSLAFIRNSVFYGNSTKNIVLTASASQSVTMDYNAYPSGTNTNYTAGPHDVVLTADPFVSGSGLNFALNSTSGGGASLKQAAFPGIALFGTGYLSIGPLQPSSVSGGTVSYAQ